MSAENGELKPVPTMAEVLGAARVAEQAKRQFTELELRRSPSYMITDEEREKIEKTRYIIKPDQTAEPVELYAVLEYSHPSADVRDRTVVNERLVTADNPFVADFCTKRISSDGEVEFSYYGASREVGEPSYEGARATESWILRINAGMLDKVDVVEKLLDQEEPLSHFVGSQVLPHTVEPVH